MSMNNIDKWFAGGDAPTDLDDEVLETIYIFRPSLLADPKLKIDEILRGVSKGPLGPKVAENSEHDVEVTKDDDEVAEVVFTFQPDQMPDPTLDLDDILNSVQSGPMSAPVDTIEEEELPDNVVSLFSRKNITVACLLLAAAAILAFMLQFDVLFSANEQAGPSPDNLPMKGATDE